MIASQTMPQYNGTICVVRRRAYVWAHHRQDPNKSKTWLWVYWLEDCPKNDGVPWGEHSLRPVPDDDNQDFNKFLKKLKLPKIKPRVKIPEECC